MASDAPQWKRRDVIVMAGTVTTLFALGALGSRESEANDFLRPPGVLEDELRYLA